MEYNYFVTFVSRSVAKGGGAHGHGKKRGEIRFLFTSTYVKVISF